jgi:hypothetical protein
MHFFNCDSYAKNRFGGFLHNRFNESILVHHEQRQHLSDLVLNERMDALIIEPEDGFSLLGMSREYLSETLGLQERKLAKWALAGMRPDFEPNISSIADWLRSTDPDVTVVGIPCQKDHCAFKGLVLVPYEASLCYQRFAQSKYNKPYRDFFYNVTFEGLFYAYHVLGARRFVISHLSASKYGAGGYRTDITLSQTNAVLNFCDTYKGIKSVVYWDGTPGNSPIDAIAYLLKRNKRGFHRPINRIHEKHFGFDFISLEWPLPADHRSNTANSGLAPQRNGTTEVPTPLETYRRQAGRS